MKTSILYITCGVILFLIMEISPPAYAQGPGFDDDVEDVEQVPIDDGVILLAAGGIVYVIKRLKTAQKKNLFPPDNVK